MEKTYNTEEVIQKLKEDYETGVLKEEDMTQDQISLLSFVYQLQIMNLDDEILEQKKVLAEYKERLRNAIEYLRSKNSNNESYNV